MGGGGGEQGEPPDTRLISLSNLCITIAKTDVMFSEPLLHVCSSLCSAPKPTINRLYRGRTVIPVKG